MREDLEATVDHFSRLPDAVIHEILLYLSGLNVEDAGRTSILSKRWNQLWFTSPYLVYNFHPCYTAYINKKKQNYSFHESKEKYYKKEFLNLLESSIQPRLEKNTSISSFRVNINFPDVHMLTPRLNRWLGMAIEKNVSTLSFTVSKLLSDGVGDFSIPCIVPQVVLLSQTLKRLCLNHCKMQGKPDIKLPGLCILECCRVYGLDEEMFRKFIPGCPLIEFLSFISCDELNSVTISGLPRLKHVTFFKCKKLKSVEIKAPNLDEFSYTLLLYSRSSELCNINLAACTTPKVLKLSGARMSFQNLFSFLPNVEVLDLRSCHSFEIMKLQIHNLKELVLKNCINFSIVGIDLDPPNLGMPLSCMNTCHLLQVHLIFPLKMCHFLWCSKLKNSLTKFSDTLKLAVFRPHWYTIIHDNLNDVSLYLLFRDEELLAGCFMCISSKSCADIVGDLLLRNFSRTLSVVSPCIKPIELICKKTLNMQYDCPLRYMPFRNHWRDSFLGFEISSEPVVEDSKLSRVFLEWHSVGGYRTTKFVLKWKSGIPRVNWY